MYRSNHCTTGLAPHNSDEALLFYKPHLTEGNSETLRAEGFNLSKVNSITNYGLSASISCPCCQDPSLCPSPSPHVQDLMSKSWTIRIYLPCANTRKCQSHRLLEGASVMMQFHVKELSCFPAKSNATSICSV